MYERPIPKRAFETAGSFGKFLRTFCQWARACGNMRFDEYVSARCKCSASERSGTPPSVVRCWLSRSVILRRDASPTDWVCEVVQATTAKSVRARVFLMLYIG